MYNNIFRKDVNVMKIIKCLEKKKKKYAQV